MSSRQEKLATFVENAQCFLESSPGLILIKDLHSTCFGMSQSLCNLLSVKAKDYIGKEDADMPWGDFSDVLKQHDREAATQKTTAFIEPIHIDKNTTVPIHVVKTAIIDKTGETIGILGQSDFIPGNNNWIAFLSVLGQKDQKILDTFFSYQIKEYDTPLKLTKREMECLFLLIRGKTAKEIARFLNLSFRTIETYVENVKIKMNATSRSEMIEKAIAMNFISIIPKNILLNSLYKNCQKWKDFLL